MMSEAGSQKPKFEMTTDIIPQGVDLDLARERNTLIECWRRGESSAETTHYGLLALYWRTQQTTNEETNVFLMESSYQFPAEAGMPFEAAEEIYQRVLKDSGRSY